jgi:hypothetical protein
VQLLGEWLRHATQRNQCEDSNGHISDVDCAFVLNSIAFLEVVRQVQNKANIIISIGREKKTYICIYFFGEEKHSPKKEKSFGSLSLISKHDGCSVSIVFLRLVDSFHAINWGTSGASTM